jgi:aminoglycoside 3-N-acetyltransferase I
MYRSAKSLFRAGFRHPLKNGVNTRSRKQRMQIKRLGPLDLAAMRELNKLFSRAFQDPMTYEENPPEDRYLADVLAADRNIALVAAEDQTILGGLFAYEFDKFEKARREIYIYDLAVDEAHRRRGIALSLLQHLTGIAKQRGAWAAYVQADHGDDAAIALYSRFGTAERVFHFDIYAEAEGPA